jgi:hypothetical protein
MIVAENEPKSEIVTGQLILNINTVQQAHKKAELR